MDNDEYPRTEIVERPVTAAQKAAQITEMLALSDALDSHRDKISEERPAKAESFEKSVNHPDHYCRPGLPECIEMIWTMGWGPGFNLGNAFKYLYRQDLKEGEASRKDIAKARWYLNDYLERTKETT